MPLAEQIKQAFSAGTTIVTSTARAARWLRREYALIQLEAGRKAWASPPIHDWGTWLRELWLEAASANPEASLLLSTLQERQTWVRTMKGDAGRVMSQTGMAALAESAYALLSAYDAHKEREHAWGRLDAEAFRRWARELAVECKRNQWMLPADLELTIAGVLATMKLPGKILLVGFDRVQPSQQRVRVALVDAGVALDELHAEEPGRATYVRATGHQRELEACALWVRDRLRERPEARIGVVVPDLAAARSEIERAFRSVLLPQGNNIFSTQAMPFEFSLGIPLADVPVIRAALLLLRWLAEPLADEELTWLLLSGFVLKDDDEFLRAAKLDAERRNGGELSLEVPLNAFLKAKFGAGSKLFARLEDFQRYAEANQFATGQRLPSRWADLFPALLERAGWPGASQRDAVYFQAMQRWERALDEIALLDFDGRQVNYASLLSFLTGHAHEVIFAPESTGAPVQIMGALESAGQQFDALWFLGADDQTWPSRERPHPLLPSDVQRRYAMPHSDPAVDLEFAQAVTRRIAASAPTVVFSYAERNRDGELRPSPLLPRDAAWVPVQEPGKRPDAAQLEIVDEDAEVAAWPCEQIAGGSEVLKKQAACPFQAFAGKRLRAELLNRNEWGLSAAERGQRMHDVLCRIWHPTTGALHTLEDLKAAKREGRLDEILRQAIAESFARHDEAEGWERAYIESEKRRLLRRLREWCDEEARRTPFTVEACEEALEHVNVGDLKLHLRVDRVDKLEDGARILIDYKSGDVSIRDWQPPRPKEPQLPLYAVFGGVTNVQGVLFAQIRAGEKHRVKGCIASEEVKVLAEDGENKELAKNPYSAELRGEWEQELRRLAGDFLRGEAAVDPKMGDETCKYCGLQGLCRVKELREAEGDVEDESEDEDA